MAFPLEKILSMSAQDYVGSDVQIRDRYRPVGVHFSETTGQPKESLDKFSKLVPESAEVVVDYQNNTSAGGGGGGSVVFYVQMSGVALIPIGYEFGIE